MSTRKFRGDWGKKDGKIILEPYLYSAIMSFLLRSLLRFSKLLILLYLWCCCIGNRESNASKHSYMALQVIKDWTPERRIAYDPTKKMTIDERDDDSVCLQLLSSPPPTINSWRHSI